MPAVRSQNISSQVGLGCILWGTVGLHLNKAAYSKCHNSTNEWIFYKKEDVSSDFKLNTFIVGV